MALTRRALLRNTSLVLAGLGLSDLYLWKFANQYQQVLAQPTSRKLALLVGINQYRDLGKKSNLKGCLTDLDLQQQLLVHRFGFHPDDIVVLKDKQATLKNIEAAFTSHLIEQARSQDSVIFHFSGYGCLLSQYADSISETTPPPPCKVLIPFDGDFSGGKSNQTIENALLEEQLALWFRSLNTQQNLCILDAGFTYPGKALLGNLRARSLPEIQRQMSAPGDPEQQERLLNQSQRRQNSSELMVLASQDNQTAIEGQWHDFSAGLLTYSLTQHLWQISAAQKLPARFNRVVADVEQQVGRVQKPLLSGPTSLNIVSDLSLEASADGVVTNIEDNGENITVWLGGVLPQVVDHYEATTCFKVVSQAERSLRSLPQVVSRATTDALLEANNATPDLYFHLDSHRGCVGFGHCEHEGQLNSGQKIQEAFRVLPKSVTLNVALGSQLKRIERVDATSAFSDMSHINPVLAGAQDADVLFTQASASSQVTVNSVPSDVSEEDEAPAPPQTQYGLFSQGGEELVDTRCESGEAIKTAVNQLHDTLKLLLARKTLHLTVNDFSSRLGASVLLEVVDAEKSQVLARQTTSRAPWPRKGNRYSSALSIFERQGQAAQLSIGQHLQYQIQNDSNSPLYWLVLGVDNRTQFFTIYSPEALLAVPETETTIQDTVAPGETLTVPFSMNEYVVRGPAGLATTYVILSRSPFVNGLEAIANKIRQSASNTSPVVVRLVNPLEVTQQVLQDLHDGSAPTAEQMGISSDNTWVLDVDQWATFQFTHEVV